MAFNSVILYTLPIVLGYMLLKMILKPTIEQTGASVIAPAAKAAIPNPNPFPAFFVSHGGPTFMYGTEDQGAFNTVKTIGTQIKEEWKPDFLVVVSAHWQLSKPNLIEIAVPSSNTSKDLQENLLVYDFYGFPRYMYSEQFRTMNLRYLSEQISLQLHDNGFDTKLTTRGIDHGVWVPLKVAFSKHNALNPLPKGEKPELDLPAEIPLIQVSMTQWDHDFDTHFKLGQALSYFRDNQIWDPVKQKYLKGMVICSGMSVHNLREMGMAMSLGSTMPYVDVFNKLLSKTMKNDDQLLDNLNRLKKENSNLLRKAHPTLEHFVPIVVAGGVVSGHANDKIKEVYTGGSLSLGWSIFRFGDNPKPTERL